MRKSLRLIKNEECTLCLTEYVVGDKIKTLTCHQTHRFHSDCLDNFIKHADHDSRVITRCPICRADIEKYKIVETEWKGKHMDDSEPDFSDSPDKKYIDEEVHVVKQPVGEVQSPPPPPAEVVLDEADAPPEVEAPDVAAQPAQSSREDARPADNIELPAVQFHPPEAE